MRSTSLFFLLLLASPCLADESWTEEAGKQSPAPQNENRIIRWCSTAGTHQRFSSANIDINGYQPCGEINVPVSCDPIGRRYIGKSGAEPYAYKSCAKGPRIVIPSQGDDSEENGVENRELGTELSETVPEPLNSKEKRDLASDLRQVEQDQSSDVEMQLQKVLDGMLGQLLSQAGPMMKASKTSNRRGQKGLLQKKQIDELIRYVDPQQQDQLRQMLEQY